MCYASVHAAPSGHDQQCAMGFLNEQSLRMIVEAPRDESRSFIFSEIPHLETSMPLNQSGPLRKMIMAALFRVTASVGWPELQIIRRASNGTSFVAFTTSTTEPKPTRYLNLYEYNVAETTFYIRPGDLLNFSWQGDAELNHFRPRRINRVRFNLAYYRDGTPSGLPMVSIVVGDCDSQTDQLMLNLLNCHNGNISESTTIGIYNESKYELTNGVIIGVVTSCTLLLIMIITISTMTALVMYWHKSTVKKSSTQENDSDEVYYASIGEVKIEMDKNEAYATCIPTESNVAYSLPKIHDVPPNDYDYVV